VCSGQTFKSGGYDYCFLKMTGDKSATMTFDLAPACNIPSNPSITCINPDPDLSSCSCGDTVEGTAGCYTTDTCDKTVSVICSDYGKTCEKKTASCLCPKKSNWKEIAP
jgi:hypothetical protein